MYRYVEKNMLILDDTTFRFDFSIRQMEVLDDLTFILLAIPNQSSEIRNVYGYKHSNRIWQVEDLSIRYPNRKNLPFEKNKYPQWRSLDRIGFLREKISNKRNDGNGDKPNFEY